MLQKCYKTCRNEIRRLNFINKLIFSHTLHLISSKKVYILPKKKIFIQLSVLLLLFFPYLMLWFRLIKQPEGERRSKNKIISNFCVFLPVNIFNAMILFPWVWHLVEWYSNFCVCTFFAAARLTSNLSLSLRTLFLLDYFYIQS